MASAAQHADVASGQESESLINGDEHLDGEEKKGGGDDKMMKKGDGGGGGGGSGVGLPTYRTKLTKAQRRRGMLHWKR